MKSLGNYERRFFKEDIRLGKDKNNGIKVISLGGQGELGKNMYVIEVNEDLYLLDAGLMRQKKKCWELMR